MKTKKRSFLKPPVILGVFSVFFSTLLLAFSPGPLATPPSATTISYDVLLENYYLLPDGLNPGSLSATELLKLQQSKLSFHVNRTMQAGFGANTEITFGANSMLESWMPPIHKAVINQNGLFAYDGNGQLITEEAHSPEAQAIIQLLANTDFALTGHGPSFDPVTSSAINSMMSAGATVTSESNGAVLVVNGDRAMRYDPVNYTIERKQFANGALLAQVRNEYLPVAGGSYTILKKSLERIPTQTKSGFCVDNIKAVSYSNYRINGRDPLLRPAVGAPGQSSLESEKITLYPNPVKDQLQVVLPTGFADDQPTQLLILDLTGSIVMKLQRHTKSLTTRLNIENLPAGVYFLKAKQEGHEKVRQFIKE